eukprot:365249-Chlamydomonas_euryale.AAC.5
MSPFSGKPGTNGMLCKWQARNQRHPVQVASRNQRHAVQVASLEPTACCAMAPATFAAARHMQSTPSATPTSPEDHGTKNGRHGRPCVCQPPHSPSMCVPTAPFAFHVCANRPICPACVCQPPRMPCMCVPTTPSALHTFHVCANRPIRLPCVWQALFQGTSTSPGTCPGMFNAPPCNCILGRLSHAG